MSWCPTEEEEVPEERPKPGCCKLTPIPFTVSSEALQKIEESKTKQKEKKTEESEKPGTVNKEQILANLDKTYKVKEACIVQYHEKKLKLTEEDFDEVFNATQSTINKSSQLPSGDLQRDEYLQCLKENNYKLLSCESQWKAFHEVLQDRLKNIAERRSATA